MRKQQPIGIFDSGLGGLSIARRIREILPSEHIIYVADSAFAPYGDKTERFITERSSFIVEFLQKQNAKAIVVACNTATVSSIKVLRAYCDLPIIGVEPGVKPASLNTRSGVIGVLATTQTLKSTSFSELARGVSGTVTIETQACPGLVEAVEGLNLDTEQSAKLVQQYVLPLVKKGADHIVLGCTHYAFLTPLIQRVAGPNINIINTDMAVARETARRLDVARLLSDNTACGSSTFWSSAAPEAVNKQIHQLWGEPVQVYAM